MTLNPDMQARKEALLKKKTATLGLCVIHQQPARFKDELGYHWCSSCKQRYDLINWGKAHDWPLIYVAPYAIGNDIELWVTVAFVGHDEAIAAFHAHLIGGTDDVEVSA